MLLITAKIDLRDPQTALRFALEANQSTSSENPLYLDVLSLAYHTCGKTAKAIKNQKKAIGRLPEGESRERLILQARLTDFEASQKK